MYLCSLMISFYNMFTYLGYMNRKYSVFSVLHRNMPNPTFTLLFLFKHIDLTIND